ncbi:MAG: hypothetical protein O9288_14605 [Novosphingobium sp.]|uniref:hypothetical protein n=1 Tax=Novosphingobium sp. TaxID=1874826 RepID=UPI0022C27617|nr:hypothetical protein [Novosphingobium sp.]MCZ8035980.1 hypothetical protein [Novosphingobium sp.]
MKTITVGLSVLLASVLMSSGAFAKRSADDPRRICREAIQKSNGQGRDAKVSRKAIDRCVENGGKI